ncbi:restriction endonuclease subunit S, partial [Archaeoglobus sp.]
MSAIQFYKETEFKEVELNGRVIEIPEDWEVVRLGDVAKKIKAGGTPKTSVKEYYENGTIPFVKIEDLTASGKYLIKTQLKITELGLKSSNAWIVPENSLLFAMYGSIGASAINKIPVATNQAILGIIPNSEKTDVEFLYYRLRFSVPEMRRQTKHGTQPNLTAKIVKEFKIPLPPLEEQKKIAHVLRTIDNAIEIVEKAVEKLERIKKATMEQL